jgi:tetratricopeptide (TPR) repeat protein
MPWTPLDGAKIHHHGYRQEALDAKDKIHRTLSMLELVVAANPNDPFQLFNLANTYFVARRYEEAARAAESSVNLLSPAGAEYGPAVYQVWATSLEQTSRPQEWLAVCRKCQQSSYHTIVNQYLLASCLMTLGEYKEALAAIEICLKMDWPTDLIGDKGIADFRRYGLHAQILGCLDRWEESLQGFEDTLKRQPGFPASNLGRAIALHEVKRFDEALEAYSLVLSEISYRSQAHFRMGQILEDREELRKAQEHYMLAWQSDVDRMDIWAKWVDTLSRLGDHAAVNHAYEALVNVKDVTSDVLVNWAHALLRTGEHAEAIACLHEAHQKNPQDSNVLFTLGDALYVSEKYADAAQVYESAVRMRMDYPEGWFVLGNTLAQMHLDEAASKCYQQTIALDPSHSAAKQNLLALKQAA